MEKIIKEYSDYGTLSRYFNATLVNLYSKLNISRGDGIFDNYLVNKYNQVDTVIKQRGFRSVIITGIKIEL